VDAWKIVNRNAANSQMIGGAVGGIVMVLTEEVVFGNPYGRYVNGNISDYHVPVNAESCRSPQVSWFGQSIPPVLPADLFIEMQRFLRPGGHLLKYIR